MRGKERQTQTLRAISSTTESGSLCVYESLIFFCHRVCRVYNIEHVYLYTVQIISHHMEVACMLIVKYKIGCFDESYTVDEQLDRMSASDWKESVVHYRKYKFSRRLILDHKNWNRAHNIFRFLFTNHLNARYDDSSEEPKSISTKQCISDFKLTYLHSFAWLLTTPNLEALDEFIGAVNFRCFLFSNFLFSVLNWFFFSAFSFFCFACIHLSLFLFPSSSIDLD